VHGKFCCAFRVDHEAIFKYPYRMFLGALGFRLVGHG